MPGVPSRLPALAAEAFGTFVLVLSGTATLLATARIGHGSVPGVLGPLAGAAFGGWIWQYLKRGRQPGEDEPAAPKRARTAPADGLVLDWAVQPPGEDTMAARLVRMQQVDDG